MLSLCIYAVIMALASNYSELGILERDNKKIKIKERTCTSNKFAITNSQQITVNPHVQLVIAYSIT